MIPAERRNWLIVGVVFVTNFFVVGSGSCITGVFLTPLVAHFGWSRTRASSLAMLLALTSAGFGLVMGWLLDRFAAQRVMGFGVAITGLALFMAGQGNSFAQIAVAHVLMGVGMAASTMIPTAVVISNWFEARRGVALGIGMAGMSLGGSAMASIATYLITSVGWRWAYSLLGGPLLVLVLPGVLLFVRTRPERSPGSAASPRVGEVEGMQTAEALRSRSFWLLSFVYFTYLSAVGVGVVHMVPYLISLRFSAQGAALVFSAALLASTLAKPVMGAIADRMGARLALSLALISLGCGFLMLTQPPHHLTMGPFVLMYGIGVGAPVALVPMLIAESFGLKHFGTLAGLVGISGMVGSAAGPMVAGRIFDVTGAYLPAFMTCAVLLAIAAVAPYGCVSLRTRIVAAPLAQKALSNI